MSRRARTKHRRYHQHFGLGTHHHNQYASSTSYFPKSYSILGKQIKFPSTAVSFLTQGNLTFYGTIQTFQNKILKLRKQQLNSIHTVNIGFKGNVIQKFSQINNCLFAFSMILCCLSEIFNMGCYRQHFYTKYQSSLKFYEKVIEILKNMPNLSTVMFTFQDNKLTKQKLDYLDSSFQKLNLKKLTLRNLCYFILPHKNINFNYKQTEEFRNLNKSKTELIFVWQKVCMKFNSKQLQEQKQSLTASLCDEI